MVVSKLITGSRELADYALGIKDRRRALKYLEATSALDQSVAFDGLHPQSLAIASTRLRQLAPSINLILPQLSLAAMFAGSRTAIEFALKLSLQLELPLRVIALTGTLTSRRKKTLLQYMASDFGDLADSISSLTSANELATTDIGEDDVWIATHWTTAHSVDVACRLGLVDPADVIYLVQDYEPGFMPWSSSFALARATYHAGFRTVVNSSPLRDYLAKTENVTVIDDLVFRPQLDLGRLEQSAESRISQTSDRASVLFYARPDKPRNLYSIGMSTLSLTALKASRAGVPISFRTAGSKHPVPRTGPLKRLEMLGKLSWQGYFEALASADVVLSLQHSPHPSHPPLDAVVSGAWAVTNELNETRGGLHPRLMAEEPDPEALSEALLATLSQISKPVGFSPELLEALGRELDPVLSTLAAQVSR